MSVVTSNVEETPADRGEVGQRYVCDACEDDPAANATNGICLDCGRGECNQCDGQGYYEIQTDVDATIERPCDACSDVPDASDAADCRGDALRDQMRDDDDRERDPAASY